jgi:uncharacterized membrane protein
MPEFVNGLPLHPLIVHFVVVLLPLAAVGAVVIAVWPAARERFGWLVVAAAAVATLLVPIATNAGGKLKARVGADPSSPTYQRILRHEELGNQMIYWAIPLLVFVAALMVVHELNKRQQINWAKPAIIVLAVLSIGGAVGAGIHVYRVGDAGSRASYGDVQNQQPR